MNLTPTIRLSSRKVLGGIVALSAILATAQVSTAEVIFQEDFTARPFIWAPQANYVDGTEPNLVNTGGAVYTWQRQFNGGGPQGDAQMSPISENDAGWGPTGMSGFALKLQTSNGVNSFLSLAHEFNLEKPIRMEITAFIDIYNYSKWWDGFSFGVTSDESINGFFSDYITIAQNLNSPVTNDIEFRAGGVVDSIPDDGTFDFVGIHNLLYTPFTFVAEYDPALAVQGIQPWTSLTINGTDIPVPTSSGYLPLTHLSGFGFGARYGDGTTKWIMDFKVEQDPVGVELEGDLDSDGFVGQSDLNLILSNWGLDIPPGDVLADWDGSGSVGQGDLNAVLSNWGQGVVPEVAAVPEPSSVLLFGLAGMGLAVFGYRARRPR